MGFDFFFSSMSSASLVERKLAYRATLSDSVLFAVIRFVTAAQSSALACVRMENFIEISMALFALPALLCPLGGKFSGVCVDFPAPQ